MFIVWSFRRPCRKNDISGSVWHKSFFQTVKCSFFCQRNVYQSFYGALLTFSYFFFKEKFCVSAHVGKSFGKYWTVLKIFVEKMISPVLFDTNRWFKRWNALSLTKIIAYQSFYGAPLTFIYFFFKEKFCVSACVGKSFGKYWTVLKCFVEKMISPVLFDTNRWFKR